MKQYTFKLSDASHKQLRYLAGAYNFTQSEIISFLIEAEYNALLSRPRLMEKLNGKPLNLPHEANDESQTNL